MIRITGGELRGRRLKTLPGTLSRPTLSRVREAVFNMLAESVRGAVFVDLFCGVGTMGVEALSRGADRALFVEHDPRCAGVLGENLKALGLVHLAEVFVADAPGWMKGPRWGGDVVFVDPPYGSGLADRSLECLGSRDGPVPGWVIVQHEPRLVLDLKYGRVVRTWSKSYGDTVVDVYREAEDSGG